MRISDWSSDVCSSDLAVILRQEDCPEGLDDSKKLTAARRARLEGEVKARALCWGLGVATVEEIDNLNILWATMLAMRSEERRVGKECVSTCRSRGSPNH